MDNANLAQVVSVVGSRFSPMTSTTDATDLDVHETLLAAAAERRQADRSEARLLELAVHQVHLHPVDETTCTATWDPSPSLHEAPEPVAGTGTPLVAERAVEELGAALDISYLGALGLVSESLELRYRLPRLWALVQAGRLQAWKARQVARHTTHLGAEAVAFVDAQAAIAGAKNRITPNLTGLVHEALIRFEPETAPRPRRSRPEPPGGPLRLPARPGRSSRYGHPHRRAGPGRRPRPRRRRSPTLATELGRLGDTTPLDERRARALGLLAHPQATLDLLTHQTEPTEPTTVPRPGAGLARMATTTPRAPRSTSTSTPRTSAATPRPTTRPPGPSRSSARPPSSTSPPGCTGAASITIKPVLDMNRATSSADAVDAARPTRLDA